MKRMLTAGVLLPALLLGLALPGGAFFWNRDRGEPEVADITKNGIVGGVVTFAEEDFRIEGDPKAKLSAVVVEELPDPGVGTLLLGGQSLEVGSRVERSALSGLRFQSVNSPSAMEAEFSLAPIFADGKQGEDFEVEILLLTKENRPPVARNMDLSTYKNVSITGYFDAVDSEGDILTFRMMSNPARGAVTMAEDGSGQFVYRPYENKTGRDKFTYVAVDEAGNLSSEATITVRIEKADTPVESYADMTDDPAHKSAIRLAEEGIYVGARMGGRYFFDPERTVTRAEFLSMAMDVAGLEPLENVTMTGFADDGAIPDWSKGAVTAALMAGAVQGSRNEAGAPVFGGEEPITGAQAAVMLDSLMSITDVPLEVFAPNSQSHWAGQAAANLAACGLIREEDLAYDTLSQPMTLSEVAQMLDGALDVRTNRR